MTRPGDPDRRRRRPAVRPAPDARAAARPTCSRSFRTAAALGWKMEANWTDPVLFFIYSVAKPVSAALILVAMLQVIAGARPGAVPRLRGRRQRAVVVRDLGDRRPGLVGPRRPRALPDAQVRLRQPERLRGRAPRPGHRPDRRRGDGRGDHAGHRRAPPRRRRSTRASVDWPLLVVVMASASPSIIAIGVILAAICLQTRQEAWSYPRRSPARCSSSRARSSRCRSCRCRSRRSGWLNPLTWWLEGVRQALFPAGLERDRRVRIAVHATSSGQPDTGRPRRSSSPCSSPGPSLHSERLSRSAGASAGPRIAGSSTRRRAPERRSVTLDRGVTREDRIRADL